LHVSNFARHFIYKCSLIFIPILSTRTVISIIPNIKILLLLLNEKYFTGNMGNYKYLHYNGQTHHHPFDCFLNFDFWRGGFLFKALQRRFFKMFLDRWMRILHCSSVKFSKMVGSLSRSFLVVARATLRTSTEVFGLIVLKLTNVSCSIAAAVSAWTSCLFSCLAFLETCDTFGTSSTTSTFTTSLSSSSLRDLFCGFCGDILFFSRSLFRRKRVVIGQCHSDAVYIPQKSKIRFLSRQRERKKNRKKK